jgi:glucosamine kinase
VIIGIDLGGTKTRIVAESDDAVVLDTTVPTTSWQRGFLLDDHENATRLIDQLTALAGAHDATIALGAHGLDNDWQTREFQSRLASRHEGRVLAVNDVELLAPAAGLDEAIAVIVGTGSKVVGHDASGTVVSAGGHGYILNDPGSAASLARDAVRAVLDKHDDGDPPDVLGRTLMAHYGVDDLVTLSYAFSGDATLASWAALGPVVFDCADDGSAIAAAVIDDSAFQLARDVGRVHARGGVGGTVICAGGVITNQPRLYRALARHIDDLGLGLTVELLTVAPVFGAVALARKLHTATTAPSI